MIGNESKWELMLKVFCSILIMTNNILKPLWENPQWLFLWGIIMPRKPKRPCGYPNCPKLIDGQYCDEHKRLTNKHYNRYGRDEDSKKFYNSKAWRRLAAMQIKKEPLCTECLKAGRITAAQIAHHTKPIREGGARLDSNSLQSLCRACHNRKHGWG